VNAVLTPLVIVLSGSLLPLTLPDALRPSCTPTAPGLVDIPFRIYFANSGGRRGAAGAGPAGGLDPGARRPRAPRMERMMRRLEMQGG